MKAVGLVTFWDGNYGSSLQCYAMKKAISSLGYRCDLIEEKHTGITEKYTRMLKKLIRIPFKTLIYPEFAKSYLEFRKHARCSNKALSLKSRQEIHFFGIIELQPKELSRNLLKQIGHSKEYIAFITGSDQVWGGNYVEPTYGNFLEFAPKSKRIAYAVSFGSNTISRYNLTRYKKGIRGIAHLSVREEGGVRLIKEVTGQKAVRMPDPTILTSDDEWKEFSVGVPKQKQPYVLVHFLDSLSENTIKVIRIIAEKFGLKILCIGWNRNEIMELKNASFVDGGPREYVSLIQNAAFICTDSFHTTLFSLRFQKQFYTFPRNYVHRYHQTDRIIDLLRDTQYSHRFIEDEIANYDDLPHDKINCLEYFKEQRLKGMSFLETTLKNTVKIENSKPNLKDDNECSGCGVCEEKCPQNAIKMQTTREGYTLPSVDRNKCISCGICETFCRKKIKYEKFEKKAYIAYSKDRILLDKSASGGVFSSIAKRIILNDGVAYGAAFCRRDGKLIVDHQCATTLDELDPLLKSKYVQSNIISCFKQIQERLNASQTILFSGTSCQIDALYRYLDKKYDNLYTLDLICHGVPGGQFFDDYIKYLEKKNHSTVKNFSFREKIEGKIEFVEHILYENGYETLKSVDKSEYYRLFFSEDSYRQNCYNCEYASVNKPADITVGDYFECKKDYPYLFENNGPLSNAKSLSCCIIHTEKGLQLLQQYGSQLVLIPADLKKVQISHSNLCYPSKPTDKRERMMRLYQKGGFESIHRYNVLMDSFFFLPKCAKKVLKRLVHNSINYKSSL